MAVVTINFEEPVHRSRGFYRYPLWDEIEHSGATWRSNVSCGSVAVWPIEEYLARTNHTRLAKWWIRLMNRHGKPEGARPRGVFWRRSLPNGR